MQILYIGIVILILVSVYLIRLKITERYTSPVINLYTCYYNDKIPARQEELDICVINNLNNQLITKVFLVLDKKDTIIPEKIKSSPKLKLIYVDTRPTFRKLFDIVNENTDMDDINIIANTDMYFDENSLSKLPTIMKSDNCLALTRYDVLPDGNISMVTNDKSQDTWIFKGSINNKNMDIDFTQGILACDNRIAYEIKKVGYKIYNPCKDFITYHLHNTNIRNYNSNTDWVLGEGINVPFISISEIN